MLKKILPAVLRRQYYLLAIVALVIASALLYALYYDKQVLKLMAKSRISVLKSCHLSSISENITKFHATISIDTNKCVEQYTTIGEQNYLILKSGSWDERKRFLLERPPGQLEKEACRWLTIGIGGETMVEKAFRRLYPKCDIYGIEAMPHQALDFSEVGQVIPHAVGPRHGNFTMRLRQKELGDYRNQVIQVRPLHEVLDEYVHARLIHFATIDIEGVEFQILDELKYGGIFDQAQVAFCQMDVELHFGVESRHIWPINFSFSAFYRDFLTHSPYVPVFAMDFMHHRKVTFLHEHHRDCFRLFGLKKYYVKGRKKF